MSETSDDYVPEADEMILAYAVYKDSRDMQKYKYDIDAGTAEWERIRNKAYAEANRFIEFVKQEACDEGYEGVDVTEERIIALLDNADFLYFVWVLQDELWHIRNEEARVVERAEAKRIAIELIRGTQ